MSALRSIIILLFAAGLISTGGCSRQSVTLQQIPGISADEAIQRLVEAAHENDHTKLQAAIDLIQARKNPNSRAASFRWAEFWNGLKQQYGLIFQTFLPTDEPAVTTLLELVDLDCNEDAFKAYQQFIREGVEHFGRTQWGQTYFLRDEGRVCPGAALDPEWLGVIFNSQFQSTADLHRYLEPVLIGAPSDATAASKPVFEIRKVLSLLAYEAAQYPKSVRPFLNSNAALLAPNNIQDTGSELPTGYSFWLGYIAQALVYELDPALFDGTSAHPGDSGHAEQLRVSLQSFARLLDEHFGQVGFFSRLAFRMSLGKKSDGSALSDSEKTLLTRVFKMEDPNSIMRRYREYAYERFQSVERDSGPALIAFLAGLGDVTLEWMSQSTTSFQGRWEAMTRYVALARQLMAFKSAETTEEIPEDENWKDVPRGEAMNLVLLKGLDRIQRHFEGLILAHPDTVPVGAGITEFLRKNRENGQFEINELANGMALLLDSVLRLQARGLTSPLQPALHDLEVQLLQNLSSENHLRMTFDQWMRLRLGAYVRSTRPDVPLFTKKSTRQLIQDVCDLSNRIIGLHSEGDVDRKSVPVASAEKVFQAAVRAKDMRGFGCYVSTVGTGASQEVDYLSQIKPQDRERYSNPDGLATPRKKRINLGTFDSYGADTPETSRYLVLRAPGTDLILETDRDPHLFDGGIFDLGAEDLFIRGRQISPDPSRSPKLLPMLIATRIDPTGTSEVRSSSDRTQVLSWQIDPTAQEPAQSSGYHFVVVPVVLEEASGPSDDSFAGTEPQVGFNGGNLRMRVANEFRDKKEGTFGFTFYTNGGAGEIVTAIGGAGVKYDIDVGFVYEWIQSRMESGQLFLSARPIGKGGEPESWADNHMMDVRIKGPANQARESNLALFEQALTHAVTRAQSISKKMSELTSRAQVTRDSFVRCTQSVRELLALAANLERTSDTSQTRLQELQTDALAKAKQVLAQKQAFERDFRGSTANLLESDVAWWDSFTQMFFYAFSNTDGNRAKALMWIDLQKRTEESRQIYLHAENVYRFLSDLRRKSLPGFPSLEDSLKSIQIEALVTLLEKPATSDTLSDSNQVNQWMTENAASLEITQKSFEAFIAKNAEVSSEIDTQTNSLLALQAFYGAELSNRDTPDLTTLGARSPFFVHQDMKAKEWTLLYENSAKGKWITTTPAPDGKSESKQEEHTQTLVYGFTEFTKDFLSQPGMEAISNRFSTDKSEAATLATRELEHLYSGPWFQAMQGTASGLPRVEFPIQRHRDYMGSSSSQKVEKSGASGLSGKLEFDPGSFAR